MVAAEPNNGGAWLLLATPDRAFLALVPWLDTSNVRSGQYRPMFKWWFRLLVVDFVVLMWVGAMPTDGIYPYISLIAATYWFAYFLVILPLLGVIEKPLAQPATIRSLSFYIAQAAGNVRFGLYDATGPDGGPGAKKAETAEIAAAVGWNVLQRESLSQQRHAEDSPRAGLHVFQQLLRRHAV